MRTLYIDFDHLPLDPARRVGEFVAPISPPTSPMNTGTVKWFDRKKGFGFAAPDAGGDDIFLHQLNLQNDSEGKRPFVN